MRRQRRGGGGHDAARSTVGAALVLAVALALAAAVAVGVSSDDTTGTDDGVVAGDDALSVRLPPGPSSRPSGRWQRDLDDVLAWAAVDDVVVVATAASRGIEVSALELATGDVRWVEPVPPDGRGPWLRAVGGDVLTGWWESAAGRGTVQRIAAADGEVAWSTSVRLFAPTVVTTGDEVVLHGDREPPEGDDGDRVQGVAVLSVSTGERRWVGEGDVVATGADHVAVVNGPTLAAHRLDGRPAAVVDVGHGTVGLAIGDDHVAVGRGSSLEVHRLDGRTATSVAMPGTILDVTGTTWGFLVDTSEGVLAVTAGGAELFRTMRMEQALPLVIDGRARTLVLGRTDAGEASMRWHRPDGTVVSEFAVPRGGATALGASGVVTARFDRIELRDLASGEVQWEVPVEDDAQAVLLSDDGVLVSSSPGGADFLQYLTPDPAPDQGPGLVPTISDEAGARR